jgi:tetratricopeptide (TPR) repeat protein
MAGEYSDMGQYPQAIEAGRKALALSPDQAVIYSVLARAERRANHFDAVKKLSDEARTHNAFSSGLHGTLYQTAVASHDPKMLAQEQQWGIEHGGWFFLTLKAEAASSDGRLADFRRLMQQARQKALDSNLHETADVISIEEATTIYDLGFPDEARRILPAGHGNDIASQAEVAILNTRLGNQNAAKDFLKSQFGTIATLANFREIPRVSAVLALANHRPDAAINALEPAIPYELGDFDIPALRGEAYSQMNKLHEAEQEYRKITTNPGIDPVTIRLPLAHLQLARIYARRGDTVQSRVEYQTLFTLWQTADADLPLLQQAKREAAALKTQN